MSSRRAICLNAAALSELCSIPMVGLKTAEAIMNGRPFRSWADVETTPGISGKKALLKSLQAHAVLDSSDRSAEPSPESLAITSTSMGPSCSLSPVQAAEPSPTLSLQAPGGMSGAGPVAVPAAAPPMLPAAHMDPCVPLLADAGPRIIAMIRSVRQVSGGPEGVALVAAAFSELLVAGRNVFGAWPQLVVRGGEPGAAPRHIAGTLLSHFPLLQCRDPASLVYDVTPLAQDGVLREFLSWVFAP
eukprot:TRINITY_DN46327_c0_g1_i1.p1 TRINITY_DN46327_c0_g1~~TRINITY_DN46327_c0_g1_i1.p1  ORF type:complete len:245 (+),score=5.96 TRINITY_DN46327_c0_g1_i1:111-845(+)